MYFGDFQYYGQTLITTDTELSEVAEFFGPN